MEGPLLNAGADPTLAAGPIGAANRWVAATAARADCIKAAPAKAKAGAQRSGCDQAAALSYTVVSTLKWGVTLQHLRPTTCQNEHRASQ